MIVTGKESQALQDLVRLQDFLRRRSLQREQEAQTFRRQANQFRFSGLSALSSGIGRNVVSPLLGMGWKGIADSRRRKQIERFQETGNPADLPVEQAERYVGRQAEHEQALRFSRDVFDQERANEAGQTLEDYRRTADIEAQQSQLSGQMLAQAQAGPSGGMSAASALMGRAIQQALPQNRIGQELLRHESNIVPLLPPADRDRVDTINDGMTQLLRPSAPQRLSPSALSTAYQALEQEKVEILKKARPPRMPTIETAIASGDVRIVPPELGGGMLIAPRAFRYEPPPQGAPEFKTWTADDGSTYYSDGKGGIKQATKARDRQWITPKDMLDIRAQATEELGAGASSAAIAARTREIMGEFREALGESPDGSEEPPADEGPSENDVRIANQVLEIDRRGKLDYKNQAHVNSLKWAREVLSAAQPVATPATPATTQPAVTQFRTAVQSNLAKAGSTDATPENVEKARRIRQLEAQGTLDPNNPEHAALILWATRVLKGGE